MLTMKAVRIHAYGGPEVLVHENAPRPEPGPGDVLVRIHAASVNPIDWKIRAGHMKDFIPYSFPFIPGWDLSGTIEAAGPGAAKFKAGEEVFAMADMGRNGTYAEYVVVKEALLARKPRSADHAQAAAVPLAALTAWHGLFKYGGLKAGQTVLIHGGAGGVGAFAIQLAKWKGAKVASTASTRNQDLLRQLGADEPIDYSSTAFWKAIKDADLVIDTVGGETQEKSFGVLKRGGILVSTVGQPSAEKAAAAGIQAVAIQNQPSAEILTDLARLMDEGRLRSPVETVLPLSEARRAHEISQSGHARGKIVLQVV